MYSSVERSSHEPSYSPISEVYNTICDDTEGTVKQNKSTQQKQYRNKQVDGFTELREAIRDVTSDQETPRTRHEILVKAVQIIKLLSLRNMRLHQQISTILGTNTCSQTNTHTRVLTQEPIMPLHWNRDVEPTGMRRTAEITPQGTSHDFFVGVGSGVCDATVLADAQDQTSTIPWNNDSLSYQHMTSGHSLNPPSTSYNTYSY